MKKLLFIVFLASIAQITLNQPDFYPHNSIAWYIEGKTKDDLIKEGIVTYTELTTPTGRRPHVIVRIDLQKKKILNLDGIEQLANLFKEQDRDVTVKIYVEQVKGSRPRSTGYEGTEHIYRFSAQPRRNTV